MRSLYDCRDIPIGSLGAQCRVVVATHPATKKKNPVDVTRAGVVYELFFTNLPQHAFTAGECFHEELRGLAPDSPYTGMLDGVVCALEGAYDQALAAYNRALEHGPDTLMSVYVLKGIGLLLMTGNYREAVTAFAQAAKLLPRVQVFAKNKNKAMRVLEGMIPWPGSARP